MRISSKGRLALCALCEMALSQEDVLIPLPALAKKLDCSKVYLEQIFSILRRADIIASAKGASGGYALARPPKDICMYDILAPIELQLFSQAESVERPLAPFVENTLHELLFSPLDDSVKRCLSGISLAHLAAQIKEKRQQGDMYYI